MYAFNYVGRHGVPIKEGNIILEGNTVEKVYLTTENELGTDATNPVWLENGRACPCEYGIYPFQGRQVGDKFYVDCEVVKSGKKKKEEPSKTSS